MSTPSDTSSQDPQTDLNQDGTSVAKTPSSTKFKTKVGAALLLRGMRAVQGALDKEIGPAGGQVLIRAENNVIRLLASGMETSITTQIPAEVLGRRDFTLPMAMASSVLGSLPGAEVVIEAEGDTFHTRISAGKGSRYKLLGTDPGKYPHQKVKDLECTIAIPVYILRELLERTMFAVSATSNKAVLRGALFHVAGDKSFPVLRVVTTDIFRMAIAEFPLNPEKYGESVGMKKIVAHKVLTSLYDGLKPCPDDEDVELRFAYQQLQSRLPATNAIGELKMVGPLIHGEYPNYEKVIPGAPTGKSTVTTAELIKACERAAYFIPDTGGWAKFNFLQSSVAVQASEADSGDCREEVDAKREGSTLNISFTIRKFIEGLKACKADKVCLETLSPEKPVVFRPVGDSMSYSFLMPSMGK